MALDDGMSLSSQTCCGVTLAVLASHCSAFTPVQFSPLVNVKTGII